MYPSIVADLAANVGLHRESGQPGDETTVRLLYLALNWLILERLTLPGVFTEAEAGALVDAAVDRLVATGAAER
nr:hypothetical protein GCM10020063_052830 [Dactylosporangium thailandense]